MTDKLVTLSTGATGAVAVEAVPFLSITDVSSSGGVVQVIIQIIIGLVTLFGLVRPKNKVNIKN